MKVYSINEWDPLKEVVIGNCFKEFEFNVDISFKLFFKDNDWGHIQGYKQKIQIKKQYIEELNEDIEELVSTIKKLGIKVYRPKKLTRLFNIRTPYWETQIIPALNVRDLTLILGDTIIETSPLLRCRYFENDLLKDIFYQAFLDGAKWISMPKPIMTDNSFDSDYTNKKHIASEDISETDEYYERVVVKDPNYFDLSELNKYEIMIDAAQFVRFGKDIIVNCSTRNHYLGVEWFKRQFPEFNFHVIHSLVANHLDSYIVPLKEGVLMLRNRAFLDIMPDFLKDWKIIYPPKPRKNIFPVYTQDDIILTTPYIDMNVLSIDGNKIIVNSMFPELVDLLYKEGFDPVPVRHRHRRLFSGGFHCFTLDLYREKR